MIKVEQVSPSEITSLSEIMKFIGEETLRQKERDKQYERDCALHNQIMEEAYRVCNTLTQGFDINRVNNARKHIYTKGIKKNFNPDYSDAQKFLDNIISDVLLDCASLRGQYFGLKNYAGWVNQSSNHFYGCGPKHGCIVVEVGLQPWVRDCNIAIRQDEKDDIIYYLLLLKDKNNRENLLKDDE